ncbi:MAG: GTP 3',8-cyclase MoaA [Verrucomicrobiae bacterium]|nr:GTP 3',8-cyclase MoaA [Verrucomicrobiae bacterium]
MQTDVLPSAGPSRDAYGRVIDYLRVSVTDRCNERCFYCMPDGYAGWSTAADRLRADEIVRAVAAAARLGVRKVRLTGGEPLVRSDLVEIAARIWAIPGIEALGVSTNGTLLATVAHRLVRAGVRSVNVSLDTLDPELYRRITGGKIAPVLEGLEAAHAAGFEIVKLNCVLLRGLNEEQILPLVDFGARHGFPVRFIELMPMAGGFDFARHHLPVAEAMRRVAARGALVPEPDARLGHGPARYYRLENSPARIGFIGALTVEHFCATCNKLRLTSDGKLRPCLGREGELDALPAIRNGGENELAEAFAEALRHKPAAHEFDRCPGEGRPMTALGG